MFVCCLCRELNKQKNERARSHTHTFTQSNIQITHNMNISFGHSHCVRMFLFLYDFANNNGFLVTFYAFVTAVSMCHLTHSFARVSFGMQPMFNLLYTICMCCFFLLVFSFSLFLFVHSLSMCVPSYSVRTLFHVTFQAIE